MKHAELTIGTATYFTIKEIKQGKCGGCDLYDESRYVACGADGKRMPNDSTVRNFCIDNGSIWKKVEIMKKVEIVPEKKYTVREVLEKMNEIYRLDAIHEYEVDIMISTVEKAFNPEYQEYLRLKAIFEKV